MATKLEERFAASGKATGVMLLISGLLFRAIVKGPGAIAGRAIRGTAVFTAGRIAAGLPLIALADRVYRVPFLLLACVGGLGGAALLFSPNVFVCLLEPQVHHAPFSIRDLAWPGAAFGVAAPTAALYRFFLDRARFPKTRAEQSV